MPERVVYLGTSEFAADVLRALNDSAHEVALVVTRPDRPKGRGRKLQSPPVADLAHELGLPLAQPDSVNEPEAIDHIATYAPTTAVVCAFGALLKEPLLSKWPMLNVHPSLLPRWRGAAPVERAMMAGDAETGVCIMRPTEGFDEGPVCAVERLPIEADDTYGTLAPRLAELSGRLLVQALDTHPPFEEQATTGIVYAEKITAEDRLLDPGQDAASLARVVRALSPHIGARAELEPDLIVGVGAAVPATWAQIVGSESTHWAQVDGKLILATADGGLQITELQPPGKRMMAATAYLRGHGS